MKMNLTIEDNEHKVFFASWDDVTLEFEYIVQQDKEIITLTRPTRDPAVVVPEKT